MVDVVIEEVVTEDNKENEFVQEEMTLAKIKDVLNEHIPKKNTLVSYGRSIRQVFEYF